MDYRKISWAALFLTSILSGCAVSVGPGEGAQKIADATQASLQNQFTTNTATKDDVAMQLGSPSTKSVAGSIEIWVYEYVKPATVGIAFFGIPVGTTKKATFYFDDASGILKKIELESHQG